MGHPDARHALRPVPRAEGQGAHRRRLRRQPAPPRGRREEGQRRLYEGGPARDLQGRGRLPRRGVRPGHRHGLHRDARPLARLHGRGGHEARQGRLLREAAHVQRGRVPQGDRRAGEVRPRVPDGLDAARLAGVPHRRDDRAQRLHRRADGRGGQLRPRRPEARRPVAPRALLRRARERGEGERARAAHRLGHVARPGEVASVLGQARAARHERVLPDVLALRRRLRHRLQWRLGRAPPRHRPVGPRHGQGRPVQDHPLGRAVFDEPLPRRAPPVRHAHALQEQARPRRGALPWSVRHVGHGVLRHRGHRGREPRQDRRVEGQGHPAQRRDPQADRRHEVHGHGARGRLRGQGLRHRRGLEEGQPPRRRPQEAQRVLQARLRARAGVQDHLQEPGRELRAAHRGPPAHRLARRDGRPQRHPLPALQHELRVRHGLANDFANGTGKGISLKRDFCRNGWEVVL